VTKPRLTALVIAAATVLAAGCGGDDEAKIPRADAAELRAALLEAKRRLAPLRCGDLDEDSLPKLEARAAQLPEGDLRDSVEEGIEHLRSLIEAECAARQEEEPDTTTETTEPDTTEPETTEPETTEPDTTEPETTEPETTEPQPEPPTDQGDGNDGGGGQPSPSGAIRPQEKKKNKKERENG
jgi:cell division septation protein DedD